VSPATTRAIATIQANGAGNLDRALADLGVLLHRFCGGTIHAGFAGASQPIVEIG
jgi:hypothetical protein